LSPGLALGLIPFYYIGGFMKGKQFVFTVLIFLLSGISFNIPANNLLYDTAALNSIGEGVDRISKKARNATGYA
jgi:hypothetical protein